MKWMVRILLKALHSGFPPRRGLFLVLVYVDDLLIASRDEKEGADFLQKLMGVWKIKLIGKIPALKRCPSVLGENHLSGKGWGVFTKFGGE